MNTAIQFFGSTVKRWGLEPELLDVINRSSGSISEVQTLKYNDFLISLKNAHGLQLGARSLKNIFTTLYLRAAHNEEYALRNFALSTFDTTKVGSVIFTPNDGFKGDGSTGSLNWNFFPVNTPYTQFSCGGVIEVENETEQGYILGTRQGNNGITILITNQTNNVGFGLNVATNSGDYTLNAAMVQRSVTGKGGFYAQKRTSASMVDIYHKDTLETGLSRTQTQTIIMQNPIHELANNNQGVVEVRSNFKTKFTFFGTELVNLEATKNVLETYLSSI